MNFRILMEALLSLHDGNLDYEIAYTAPDTLLEVGRLLREQGILKD